MAELEVASGRWRPPWRLDEVAQSLRNLTFRSRVEGAVVWDKEAGFFVVAPFENQIYRYDNGGRLERIYRSTYKGFRRPERDAPDSSPGGVMA